MFRRLISYFLAKLFCYIEVLPDEDGEELRLQMAHDWPEEAKEDLFPNPDQIPVYIEDLVREVYENKPHPPPPNFNDFFEGYL